MKLPDLKTEKDGITPIMPKNAYAEDYRDDWIDLVARRLAPKMPDLSRGQRYILANVAFERRYRRMTVICTRCKGSSLEPPGDENSDWCTKCNGSGQETTPTARYVGRDARTRPVVERLEYGQWRRWALGREGQPVDVVEPVKEGKPY